jgi:DNA modification methylase
MSDLALSKTIWPISKLRNWEKNPRGIKEKDFERLKRQIVRLGQYKPLLITSDGEVLGGNMRLRAYKDLGMTEAWVSVVEPKTEAEKLEYALSDNDRVGYYEDDKLAELLIQYKGEIDLGSYSVDLGRTTDLQTLLDQFSPVIEDEVPEVDDTLAVSKLGEVYQLGRHRLMCGDSTKVEDVEKLMDGKKADMVFTDPPYNIGFGYKEYNDIKSEKEYKDFCMDWFNLFSIYPLIFTPGPRNIDLYPKPTDIGTWVKRGGKSGASLFYLRFCEPILFYGQFKKKRDTDLFEYNMEGMTDLNSARQSSGINIKRKDREYAPAKPIKFIVDILKSYSENNDKVIDCFGGNGSTLIACEQTNRTCYMMELSEKYCDVIRKRYYKFIGKENEWKNQ